MYRFVDITEAYFAGPCDMKLCAFIDTVSDTFIASRRGIEIFHSAKEICAELSGSEAERCLSVVPAGFWDKDV